MKKGTHANLLFFSSQFLIWTRTFVIENEKLYVHVAGGSNKTIQIEVFQCGKKTLVYVRVPGTYNSDHLLKRLDHMGVVDSSVKFWRWGLPSANILKKVYYQAGGRVTSSFPGWNNVM